MLSQNQNNAYNQLIACLDQAELSKVQQIFETAAQQDQECKEF